MPRWLAFTSILPATLAWGDGAVDRVTVNGAAGNEIITVFSNAGVVGVNGASAPVAIFNAESGDQLVVNGGAGNDTIDASSLPLGTIISPSTAAPATTRSPAPRAASFFSAGPAMTC